MKRLNERTYEQRILDQPRPHARECDCEDCNEYDELLRIEKRSALKQDLTKGEIIERYISRVEQEEIAKSVLITPNKKGNA
jgi:hypothetical protein